MTKAILSSCEVTMEATMPVATSRFGQIEVDMDKIITMTSPLLGFPDSRRFILRPHSGKSPFLWLQSIDEPQLAFVVVEAGHIDPSYHPPLSTMMRQELELGEKVKPELLIILTIPRGNPQAMTANFLGPIVINATKRLARQVLLDPTAYNPCQPLFQ